MTSIKWHGDKFQYFHHARCYELLPGNTSNLSVCCYYQKIDSPHMANVRGKKLMTLWGYRYSLTGPSVPLLAVPITWSQGLDSNHFSLYRIILYLASQWWVPPLLMMGLLATPPIDPHFELAIIILVTLPNIFNHHNLYESPHFWILFQYRATPHPLVYPPWWSQILIFRGPRIPV